MRLIQLIISHGLLKRIIFGCFLFLGFSAFSFAQTEKETNLGTSLSLVLQKDFSRFLTWEIEQELRLINNNTGFERSVTATGLDYTLFAKRVKIGAYYAFMYLYNNSLLYEPRHRYYFNLSYKQPLNDFTLSWRGRFQSTFRDEDRGRYKVNPKQVLKNKFEIEYTIFGSPWKPYFSFDFSTFLNDPVMGHTLTKIRYQGGVNWRMNRTDYMEFFLRYDDYQMASDNNALFVGAIYRIKLK